MTDGIKTRIGIVDDQQLFLGALTTLVRTFPSFEVIVEAINGEDLTKKLEAIAVKPDIMLVDVKMPVMDGPATVKYLSKHFPAIKTVALSTMDDDRSILNMIRAGCCAYLAKGIQPAELEHALYEVHTKGIYNGDIVNNNYRRLLTIEDTMATITQRELAFLKLASCDLTYKEIAKKMILSERTIDGYRESLFIKFRVKSRVGLVMEALRQNLIDLE